MFFDSDEAEDDHTRAMTFPWSNTSRFPNHQLPWLHLSTMLWVVLLSAVRACLTVRQSTNADMGSAAQTRHIASHARVRNATHTSTLVLPSAPVGIGGRVPRLEMCARITNVPTCAVLLVHC